MDSDSSRARIDQFFASKKKRKILSPGPKSKSSNQTRNQIEGSPSAKGSLESYLVTSLEDSPVKSLNSVLDENGRRVKIKRNLTLETGNHSRNENQAAGFLNQGRLRSPEPNVVAHRIQSEVLSDTSSVATKRPERVSRESENIGENTELKDFATGFLSLFCSELPSNISSLADANANPVQSHSSSSGFQLEEKSAEGRHCATDVNPSDMQRRSPLSPKVTKPPIVTRPEDLDSRCFQKVIMSNTSHATQASLRKCSSASATRAAKCETPSSFRARPGTHITPVSIRGSSFFSPGESFWNEAILVADGLYAPSDGIPAHGAECSEILKLDYGTYTLNVGKDEGCGSAVNRASGDVGITADDVLSVSAVVPTANHGKNIDKETSPLPVKHLDFCFDDKICEEGTTSDADDAEAGILTSKVSTVSTLHQFPQSRILPQRNYKDQKSESNIAPSNMRIEHSLVGANHECRSNCSPASSTSIKDDLVLGSWLPPEICSVYKKKGISKLYPWQVACLQVDGVLHNRNLVYCASTSAGKSFVAEILMLRRILSMGKIALLVLPYVSICTEKAEHLELLLEPVDKHVRSYYGNQGGGTLPKDTSVAVCTIEKANSLINRLLEEDRLSELGTIVIDELHMVGDQSRGYLLELMLTKLRYAAGEGNPDSTSGESSGTSSGKSDPARGLQIIGMSATLPNVAAVADWLQAALYETDFRPVPLEEYIKVGSTIYDKKMEIIRTIPKVADLGGKDPDHIIELCNEVVQEGHSVLIFCSSRKGCESTARHVAKYLKSFLASPRNDQSESFDVSSAIDSLRRSPAGLDPTLEETIPFGVAYHHAGLTIEEREVVETCYRKGIVRVLTATSTLAAGVNLPARRVVFRQPRIGRDFIDGTRYKQMSGRAGRTGIDTKGESVLICKPEEVKKIMSLLNDGCSPLHSCLSEDRNGMTHAILEVVAGGIVQTASDIHRYVRCTLLNSTKPFENVVRSAQDSLRWLCHKKFLEWNEETKLYTSTPLGRASFGSSLCPEESLVVLDDLMRAREGFVLASDLHLVYLVTPINVEVEPDWELYYERFMQLPSLEQSVGNRVGVQEPFLMRMAHGGALHPSHRSRDNPKGFQRNCDKPETSSHGMLSDEQILRVCRRFYVALILAKLVQEVPVTEVCEGFRVARGMVQALQENAGRFASMVSVFCERLGWHDLESLVAKFQNRVSFGVRAEIVELTAIPYIKGSRARALYKAGFRTPQAIAEASVPEIFKALFESSSWTSHSTAQRKVQMGVAKKIKNGARKIVFEKAEEARVAAFSAFKSLGVDISQFSRPLLQPDAEKLALKASLSGERLAIVELDSGKVRDNSTDASAVGIASSMREKLGSNPQGVLTEKSDTLAEGLNLRMIKHNISDNCIIGSSVPSSVTFIDIGRTVDQSHDQIDHAMDHGPENNNSSIRRREISLEKGPVNAINVPGGLDSFLDLWCETSEFFFDIHFNKKSELNSIAPFEVHGIAICWEKSPVYYLNIPKDLFRDTSQGNKFSMDSQDSVPPKIQLEMAKKRWIRIGNIMERNEVKKFTWNLKVQIQVLKNPAVSVHKLSNRHGGIKRWGLDLIDNSYFMISPIRVRNAIDICIVAWVLSPDEQRSSCPNLEKEAKKRLSSEVAASTSRSGRWKDQMRRAAHNGCCRRVAQTRAVFSILWKLLESEELVEPLISIEILLANVLADMEIWGIGVDMEGCLKARQVIGRKLKCLEKEAYRHAGKTFSLSMPADIANVLYDHLKLPMPEGYKGKQHPSTDKHCLDLLRNEHPIIPIIKEHRSLAKLMNSTLGSICSLAKLSVRTQKYTLHGHWLQTSTVTGRLSMEEPNLQCVEHTVEFKLNEDDRESGFKHYKINPRDFFIPTQDDWLLLAADYSQIELRLMAHFSRDSSLIKLLSCPEADVFTIIAAKWSQKHESNVSTQDREQTKRLIYGILYGMGTKTLAEQLNCSSEEAAERIQSFKKSFPGVASWLQEAVSSCHEKGYVETLKGRKRFLAKIKFGNGKEKCKAQRQAVNSICQGSAADIIKIAMICIHNVIGGMACPFPVDVERFKMVKGRCRILVQVHDELILECDPSVVKEAGLLLRTCMEHAVSLVVPTPVKLKYGRTWGSMQHFEPNL